SSVPCRRWVVAARPTTAGFRQASAAEDLACPEVEVGGVVDVRVGAVVEGDREVMVAAGHVDDHREVAELDDRGLVEGVLADGHRGLGESSDRASRGEAA